MIFLDIAIGLDDFGSDLEDPFFLAAGRLALWSCMGASRLLMRVCHSFRRNISFFQLRLNGSGLLIDGLRNLGKVLDWNILLNGINQIGIGIQFFE